MSNNNNHEAMQLSLLKLAEKCLAQSRLIFLVADLRLLSSTGRIHTKFDVLCLDSDRFLRTTAASMACVTEPCDMCRGITPSHVMAILLLEMNKSLTDQSLLDDDDQDDMSYDGHNGLLNNLRLSRSDPILARKAEGDLHALLRAYCHTMRGDLCEDMPKVPISLLAQMSSGSMSSSGTTVATGTNEAHAPFGTAIVEEEEHVWRNPEREETKLAFTALGEHFFSSATDDDQADVCSKDDLVRILKRAIAKRDSEGLDFLTKFFQEGTVTRMMAESRTELVWLHDWHVQKECTYAISVDREENAVVVIFRGATTYTDWERSIYWSTMKAENPIKDDYPGKNKYIKMHGGYHRYLFRQRKDTRTTKYDEIASKVHDYGTQLGDNYRLVVTGHSLGGALTNIFAFYASLEERFTKNAPIQAVTFGCPRMAAYQFIDAIRHQEDTGKLQIARFHNEKDAITHLPPHVWQYSKRGAKFYHVGLDVKLPLIRKNVFRLFGQPQPSVQFLDPESWKASYARQWREFYGFNIPIRPWMLANHHSLMEHQKRMHLPNADSPLVKYSLSELYQMRPQFTSNRGEKTIVFEQQETSVVEQTGCEPMQSL
ncbi:hypothetical protein MHU86_3791 [Fragilaria crotonensis]|nr:hypothetical protein MHU86_3791 [Fragilaria crotonensis]